MKRKKTNKRAIIVGGSGFLGSHVADELSMKGFETIIYDKVKPNVNNDKIRFIQGDITSREKISKLIKKNDYIFYFAGVADLDDAVNDPLKTIEENVLNLTKFLTYISKKRIDKFIYASTMYVFNDKGSIYGASKQSAEKIIYTLSQLYKFSFTFLRYGSLYGPRSQEWNGLRSYVKKILSDKKILYEGSGDERREYIHVKDASRLTLNALDDANDNVAIHISGEQTLTSKEILSIIFETANIPKKIKFLKNKRKKYHYTLTPYQVHALPSKKLVPNQYKDIAEGIYELIIDIQKEKKI